MKPVLQRIVARWLDHSSENYFFNLLEATLRASPLHTRVWELPLLMKQVGGEAASYGLQKYSQALIRAFNNRSVKDWIIRAAKENPYNELGKTLSTIATEIPEITGAREFVALADILGAPTTTSCDREFRGLGVFFKKRPKT